MSKLTEIRLLIILAVLICALSCKKEKVSDSTEEPPTKASAFHIDNVIEEINSDYNGTRLISNLKNNEKLISISGRGRYDGDGFRLIQIDKKTGIDWLKSFTSENNSKQSITCSDIDQEENIWVGGHAALNNENGYAYPLLSKVDKSGNLLFSRYFPKMESEFSRLTLFGTSLKVLSNGDVLFLMTGSTTDELARLSKTGEIIWNIRLENEISYNAGGANSNRIMENAQGEIFVLTSEREYNKNSEGLHLYKFSPQGQLIFTKNYQFAPFDLDIDIRIYQLQSNDLLLFGHKSISSRDYPYIIKVDPANGNVKESIYCDGGAQGLLNVRLANFIERENDLVMNCIIGSEYSLLKFDKSLNLLSTVKTLSKNSGGLSGAFMLHDKEQKALYHIIDDPGPLGGTGFQMLKTDESGVSCHTFTKPPTKLLFQKLHVTQLNVIRSFIDKLAPSLPLNWNKTEVLSIKKNVVCN